MNKVPLGNTSMTVSRLGIGLAEIGFELSLDHTKQAGELLSKALDNGINFLDTAACYGISEEFIGKTVANRRSDFFLASKAGHVTDGYNGTPWAYETIKDSIDRSLHRMKTDYLDIIQLHSCGVDILEKGDAIRAVQDARTAGKTRYIGYSGDNEDAHWAVDSGIFDTLQTSFNIVEQRANTSGLLKKAKSQGMGTIIKRPIAGGAWRFARTEDDSVRGYDRTYLERARAMAKEGAIQGEDSDPIAFSMAFLFAHEEVDVAIVGTKNTRHMEANLRTLSSDRKMSGETVEDLHRRFDKLDSGWTQLT